MGTWSVSVSGNDDYQDIYSEILKEINSLTPLNDALDKIYKRYFEIYCEDDFAQNSLIYALAYAAWEYGLFENTYRDKTISLISNDFDLECLRDLGLSEQDLERRKTALLKFIDKISTPNKKPKEAKLTQRKASLYKKGDVLQIKHTDGTYSGAIVLDDIISSDEYCSNFIVKAAIQSQSELTVEDVLNSGVYNYAWYIKANYKKHIAHIKVISNIKIAGDYSDCTGPGSQYSGWITLVSENNKNSKSIIENSDIENLSEFIHIKPDDIKVRQKNRTIKYIQSLGIK